MATLYKRPGFENWYYDITGPDGRRRRMSTRTKNKREAAAIANEADRRIRAIPNRGVAPKETITVRAAVDAYIKSLEAEGKPWAVEAASLRARTFGLGNFSGRGVLSVGLKLDWLSEGHLDEIRSNRRKEGLSVQSIAHELKVLRAATILAASLGHPAPSLRWRVPTAPAKTRYLTQDEWRRVYDEMDPNRAIEMKNPGRRPRDGAAPPKVVSAAVPGWLKEAREQARDLFVVLTLCGGRWGEVSRLTADQVVPGGITLFGYKTGRERVVPCLPIMEAALKRRKALAAERGTPYLFPAARPIEERQDPVRKRKPGVGAPRDKAPQRGAGPDDPPAAWQTQSSAIRRAFERADLNPPHLVERHGRATIHSLRHTFATWLLQGGRSLQEVQALLGHTGSAMTQRYAHLDNGKVVRAAAATLGQVMDSIMGTSA